MKVIPRPRTIIKKTPFSSLSPHSRNLEPYPGTGSEVVRVANWGKSEERKKKNKSYKSSTPSEICQPRIDRQHICGSSSRSASKGRHSRKNRRGSSYPNPEAVSKPDRSATSLHIREQPFFPTFNSSPKFWCSERTIGFGGSPHS